MLIYVVHFFSGTVYSRGLKFLQVIYESFDCDLTCGYFIQDFNKSLFYDDIKKIFIEIMNKKIRLLNHSQNFFYVIIKKIFIEITSKKSLC